MICGDGQYSAATTGHLIVRNTFLEFFDDSTALGPYEGGRRQRVVSDDSDLRLPAKVKYKHRECADDSSSPIDDADVRAPSSQDTPATLLSVLEEPPAPPMRRPQQPCMTLPMMFDLSARRTTRGAYPSIQVQAYGYNGAQNLMPAPHTGSPHVSLDSLNSVWTSSQLDYQELHSFAVPPARGSVPVHMASQESSILQKASSPTSPSTFSNGAPTTIMLRNLPNRYTQSSLIQLLDDQGFKSQYDFIYLPIDFRNGVNLGYAFVNFAQHHDALRAVEAFHGFFRWFYESSKVCEVSWSHPHQGLEEHIDRYRNSPVMHHCMPDEYKPMIFSGGVRVQFPPPTKAIKAPKLRPVRDRLSKNET